MQDDDEDHVGYSGSGSGDGAGYKGMNPLQGKHPYITGKCYKYIVYISIYCSAIGGITVETVMGVVIRE